MKQTTEKLKFLSLVLLACTISSLQANTFISNEISATTLYMNVVENDLIGAWQYSVENATPEYREGVISISEQSGQYMVQVQIGQAILVGENVSVDGNEIKFNLQIEGGLFDVALIADGDTISGKSTSADGVFPIAGERVKPE